MLTFCAIKRNGKFLQKVEPNEYYKRCACSPTMGIRHTYNEFQSVWGDETVFFEPLTAMSNIRIILEEYRWEALSVKDLEIIVKEG